MNLPPVWFHLDIFPSFKYGLIRLSELRVGLGKPGWEGGLSTPLPTQSTGISEHELWIKPCITAAEQGL